MFSAKSFYRFFNKSIRNLYLSKSYSSRLILTNNTASVGQANFFDRRFISSNILERYNFDRGGSLRFQQNLSRYSPNEKQKNRIIKTRNYSKHGIENLFNKERVLQVNWEDKNTCDYPYVFLRENCQCPQCFHSEVQTRIIDTVEEVDINIQPKHSELIVNKLKITWPDNHVSLFESKWLKDRMFPKKNQNIVRENTFNLLKVKWDEAMITEQLPTVFYKELVSDDDAKIKVIEGLITHGICLIKDGAKQSGLLYEMAKLISMGYIKKTHYGEIFTVKNKANPSNLAYTSRYLPLHMDLGFLSYSPELQFLHCIEQSDGENSGANLFMDGFNAIDKFKKENRKGYDILTEVKFQYFDVGTDDFGQFHMALERPVIGFDSFGEYEHFMINNVVRDSYINAPTEKILEAYEAYYAIYKIIRAEENILKLKLNPGDIIAFNNKRVLHGRMSYDATKTSRWLEGCYFDWDEVHSKYRVLKAKQDRID